MGAYHLTRYRRQNVKPTPPTNKPKLLDQVREVIRRKHYSIRPEQALGEKPSGVKSSESRRRNHRVARRARVRRGQLFFPVAQHFAAQRAAIDAGEVSFHCGCQQREVRDFAEVFGDEPDRFFRGHPVQMIESRQVHRA